MGKKRVVTIHDQMREKTELAFTYAEDGAMLSAARIFREIADTYLQRGNDINAELNAMIREGRNSGRS